MGQASLTSVTEYLLTQPILSFVVSGHTPFPTTNGDGESGESGEEGEGGRGEGRLSPKELDSRRTTMLIKLHCIHTRLELFVFAAKTIQPPTLYIHVGELYWHKAVMLSLTPSPPRSLTPSRSLDPSWAH